MPFDGSFCIDQTPSEPPKDCSGESDCREQVKALASRLGDLQELLYAQKKHALLLIFQGMDASGKDSTIRAVLRGIDPAGLRVTSFKQPTVTELSHDFLWRTTQALPERGIIGVFNRSHYEAVLAVRVHPHLLQQDGGQSVKENPHIWEERLHSIRDHECHLARNGTVILKFWLNISRSEQARRLRARLRNPEKHWKFSAGDLRERRLWPRYQQAYEAALRATSREWAPWYAIPADDKPYMQLCVASVLMQRLEALGMEFPRFPPGRKRALERMSKVLARELKALE